MKKARNEINIKTGVFTNATNLISLNWHWGSYSLKWFSWHSLSPLSSLPSPPSLTLFSYLRYRSVWWRWRRLRNSEPMVDVDLRIVNVFFVALPVINTKNHCVHMYINILWVLFTLGYVIYYTQRNFYFFQLSTSQSDKKSYAFTFPLSGMKMFIYWWRSTRLPILISL